MISSVVGGTCFSEDDFVTGAGTDEDVTGAVVDDGGDGTILVEVDNGGGIGLI